MRTGDFEYGFLGRAADDLRQAVERSRGEGKTDDDRMVAVGTMRGVVTDVVARIERLRENVRKEDSVLQRVRGLFDDRARYERAEGDHEDARIFFEVDLEDPDSVEDLLYHMERRHWSRECDEYAAVWATHMAHKFGAAMAQVLELIEEMALHDGCAA
jgi:hypothetical protein